MIEVAKQLYFASLVFLSVFTKELKSMRRTLQSSDVVEYAIDWTHNFKKFIHNYEDENEVEINKELKYILLWTKSKITPLAYIGAGQENFLNRNCKYSNCFVTFDRSYLVDVTNYDAIVFSGSEVIDWHMNEIIPKQRSTHQKYVFATFESADNFPVCSDKLENIFNWTWTYRLDSEAQWGFIVVRDADGKVIGPRKDMHWMKLEDMAPVADEFEMQLRNKTFAAAWFVSNCKTRSGREHFVNDLKKALFKYGLEIDIYGKCGQYECKQEDEKVCLELVMDYYYFYLAFENSFSEDYVTDKVLYGLNHNAIPIVYGGANYTRFMPDGIYLNARELGPKKLAKKMRYLIDHPDQYKEYFRWKNHYSFHARNEDPSTDDYCGFCELLNDKDKVKSTSIYKNFKEWWSEPKRCLYFGEHF